MSDNERLREALLELELLRAREAERSRETSALLAALEALTVSKDNDQGIAALLRSARDALTCDQVLLFEIADDALVAEIEGENGREIIRWTAPGLARRSRRIVDLQRISGLWDTPPQTLSDMRSLLSMPFGDGTQRMVFAAFSGDSGKFTAADADLMKRLTSVASQAIVRRSLEARNAFLAAVIDKSPVSVAIAEANANMPLVFVNDAFVGLSGYEREDILGQNCRLLSAEEPDSDVRKSIRQTVAERTTGNFTLRNRKKSGEMFWNDLRLFPVGDLDGAPTHMVATQTDATQRMQAEIERDEARRRLESALTATTEAFLILGKQGQLRFANVPFEDLLSPIKAQKGKRLPADALELLLGDRFDPSDPIDTLISNLPLTREIVTADGRQYLVRARAVPDGGVVVAASDVTQIKVNERALRQRLAVIERSQDGVAIGDREGRIVDVNPSLLSLWGLESDEDAIGRKWTKFYDRQSLDGFNASDAWFQRSGVWRGEAEITRDGRVLVHDVSLSLVPEVGSVLIVRDVTERRRNAEERSELRRRLDRAQMQERLHQVSAGLAHDFNNLLSAILGSVSLIEATKGIPPSASAAVKRIQMAATRAAELTDGFLDLGSREKSAENVELGAVLRNTVDLARGSAPRGVHLSASLRDTPLMIEASQTDILQVVMNLVVNGIDAHEGMPGEVRVSVGRGTPDPDAGRYIVGLPKPGQDYAAIVVEDSGKGMSDDLMRNILEPYFTTKGNTGTGLGLAIVASIVSENDGLLEVDTVEDRGTKFTIWWPTSSLDEASDEAPRTPRASRPGLPVLILDDVAEVAAAIAAILSAEGYEVAETNDPEVALETIEEDPDGWACLITDYDMPGITGGDLIERLRNTAPELPCIVVSALARRLTDKRLRQASAVLQKPIDKDKLLTAVRAATANAPNTGDD